MKLSQPPLSSHGDQRSSPARKTLLNVIEGLETALNYLQGAHDDFDQNPYLKDNYGPVANEVLGQSLPIEGSLPEGLSGLFIRNGPNPILRPLGGYNWFDGDGMLHGCRIKAGQVSYCNHAVRTERLKQEMKAGTPLFFKIGEVKGFAGFLHVLLFAAKVKLGYVDPKKGIGTANTSIVFHAQRLLALQESDMPYAVRVMCSGLLRSLSRQNFGGKLQHAFTAHPKVDPVTGDLLYFGYELMGAPFLSFGVMDKTGTILKDFPIHTIKEPIMMHDFAITREHVIFFECPMIFDTTNMVAKNDGPFRWDASRPTRFWVLSRHASSSHDIRCFTYPEAMFVMHTAAAFEEGETIFLYASAQPRFQLVAPAGENAGGPLSHSLWHPHLYEFTFNLTTGEMTRTPLAPGLSSDMPAIDRSLTGSKVRFIYTATMTTGPLVCFDRLVKYDLQAPAGCKVVGLIDHGGPRYVGGEAFFVPRTTNRFFKRGEDDGYLLTYVHDTKLDISHFVVYDARTFDSEPLARVKLPQRVPYGFHCLFVPDQDLKDQDFSIS